MLHNPCTLSHSDPKNELRILLRTWTQQPLPLTYLRCAGLGVTRLPLLRPELGLTVVTGCHVVRKTTHLPDPKPALARLGALWRE